MRTAAWSVAAVLLGSLTAAATVLVHQSWWWLVVGYAAGVLALWVLPSRVPRVFWSLVWGAVVLRAADPRPEGDFLVPGNAGGWTLLGGAAGLLLIAVVLPDRRPRRTADHGSRPDPT